MDDCMTHRMAGGAPAGNNILLGELGCLTKRTKMRMTTRRGNMMTTPSGTETVELPRRRKGRRKNASLDAKPFRLDEPRFSSWAGSCSGSGVVAGAVLEARLRRSMVKTTASAAGMKVRLRGWQSISMAPGGRQRSRGKTEAKCVGVRGDGRAKGYYGECSRQKSRRTATVGNGRCGIRGAARRVSCSLKTKKRERVVV